MAGAALCAKEACASPLDQPFLFSGCAEGVSASVSFVCRTWSKRGVLLLNASLTVRSGEANSHAELGWQTFTDAIVKTLNQRKEPIVFILWGKFAEKKGASISRSKHHVIVSAHPSPLSVTKFRGCKCFSKANKYLTDKGLEEIDWNVDE